MTKGVFFDRMERCSNTEVSMSQPFHEVPIGFLIAVLYHHEIVEAVDHDQVPGTVGEVLDWSKAILGIEFEPAQFVEALKQLAEYFRRRLHDDTILRRLNDVVPNRLDKGQSIDAIEQAMLKEFGNHIFFRK